MKKTFKIKLVDKKEWDKQINITCKNQSVRLCKELFEIGLDNIIASDSSIYILKDNDINLNLIKEMGFDIN